MLCPTFEECVCVVFHTYLYNIDSTKDKEETAGLSKRLTGSVAYKYKTCCWLAIHSGFITTQLCSGCNSNPLEP